MKHEISNTDDCIDARNICERIEELESAKEDFEHDDDGNLNGSNWADSYPEEADELENLSDFIGQARGNGGDHQWRGDWYPVTFINDGYFTEYAQELAVDIGAINEGLNWPYTCIDWEQAARELQGAYCTAEFDGVTYWYR